VGFVRSKLKWLLLWLGCEKIVERWKDRLKGSKGFLWGKHVPLSAPEVYNSWIKSQHYQMSPKGGVSSPDRREEPRIRLVFFDPLFGQRETQIDQVISSLRAQANQSWEMTFVLSRHSPNISKRLESWRKKGSRISLCYWEEPSQKPFLVSSIFDHNCNDFFVFMWDRFVLAPESLAEIVKELEKSQDFFYCDEDKLDHRSHFFFDPQFKPDWSPDTLRSYNYVGSFFACNRKLLEKIVSFENAYDLILQLTEKTNLIVHSPKVLVHLIRSKTKTYNGDFLKILPECKAGGQHALVNHFGRLRLKAEIKDELPLPLNRVSYHISEFPMVSIIIPNKDHLVDLKRCVESIIARSTYENFEIIIVENNSTTSEIFDYYRELSQKEPRVKLLTWTKEFNYSAINNFAVQHSRGKHLLFLNNDIEVITPSWIQELLMYSMREDVGIVGAKLLYPDGTIQHAGVIIGMRGLAAHVSRTASRHDPGYCFRLKAVQNLTAVTAACSMVKKSVFEQVQGFDESLIVAFNDIDLCLKVRSVGKLNIFTPYAELFHFESLSRGFDDTSEKQIRFQKEVNHFFSKWDSVVKAGDPYYNVNLSLENEEIKLRT
jgi:GT2 family glycosyltransferase